MEGNDKHAKYVFIAYSHHDITLVQKIKARLQEHKISTVVASDDFYGGTSTINNICDAVSKSYKSLYLITENSLQSSWFAFEAILSLERSQEQGKVGAIMLLHGVTPDKLPDLALFRVMPQFNLDIDAEGNWRKEQVLAVKEKIKENIDIDCVLPVGNVAHAQAWSHFFGYHNVIHEDLEGRIRSSQWYRENPANFPIVVFELIPWSCKTGCFTDNEKIKLVGHLDDIIVRRAGQKERRYRLNVYCLEENDEKYYCVTQCPNVLSAILKMEDDPKIDMDAKQKQMQVARFVYTLNLILHHKTDAKCSKQTRILDFDDSKYRPEDELLKAIKTDVESMEMDFTFALPLQDLLDKTHGFDAAILCSGNGNDRARALEIEGYLKSQQFKINQADWESTAKIGSSGLEDTMQSCRWLILLLSEDGMNDKAFYFEILSVLAYCLQKNDLRLIPVIENPTENPPPHMLRWITYIDMRAPNYMEKLSTALKGRYTPVAIEANYLPAGNLGYGLAWGYVVNYIKTVLKHFGPHLQNLKRNAPVQLRCPEKLYLLIPESCTCGALVSDSFEYIEHFYSFSKIDDTHGGANIIKSLDIYSIDDDNNTSAKYHFIGQYPAPIYCLMEMNDCGKAGIREESMKREATRFCDTFISLMTGEYGEGLHTKCELVRFNDSDPEDLRRKLLPILRLATSGLW